MELSFRSQQPDNITMNKNMLLEYANLFPELMSEISKHRNQREAARASPDPIIGFGKFAIMTRKALYESNSEEHRSYVNYIECCGEQKGVETAPAAALHQGERKGEGRAALHNPDPCPCP